MTLFRGESCALMRMGGKKKRATCYAAGLGQAGGVGWTDRGQEVTRRRQQTSCEHTSFSRGRRRPIVGLQTDLYCNRKRAHRDRAALARIRSQSELITPTATGSIAIFTGSCKLLHLEKCLVSSNAIQEQGLSWVVIGYLGKIFEIRMVRFFLFFEEISHVRLSHRRTIHCEHRQKLIGSTGS